MAVVGCMGNRRKALPYRTNGSTNFPRNFLTRIACRRQQHVVHEGWMDGEQQKQCRPQGCGDHQIIIIKVKEYIPRSEAFCSN